MACLLLLWLIKTWNGQGKWESGKEEHAEKERERDVCFHFEFICRRKITVDSSTLVGYQTDMKEKKQQQQSFETVMQFFSLIAYNTLTLRPLWTLTLFELSLINSVSQTDDWSYLTVRFMTPYYTATVNRSGLCLFLRAFVSLLSCLPAPLTVLRAVCCLCRCFYAIYFSKFQLENPLWSSVWVKSCLNSYLSSQKPTVEEQSLFHWINWMR